MSTPMGFRYLYDAGYIDREMDLWFHVGYPLSYCQHDLTSAFTNSFQERNIYYVVQIEVFLAKAFNFIPIEDDEELL